MMSSRIKRKGSAGTGPKNANRVVGSAIPAGFNYDFVRPSYPYPSLLSATWPGAQEMIEQFFPRPTPTQSSATVPSAPSKPKVHPRTAGTGYRCTIYDIRIYVRGGTFTPNGRVQRQTAAKWPKAINERVPSSTIRRCNAKRTCQRCNADSKQIWFCTRELRNRRLSNVGIRPIVIVYDLFEITPSIRCHLTKPFVVIFHPHLL